jgi:hypothetical protein
MFAVIRHMTTVAIAVLSVLALPAAAHAQDIPPENSGVGQYVEGVPGAGGDKPSDEVSPDDPGATDTLTPDQQEAIESLSEAGEDGRAAAGLATATAPDRDDAERVERGAVDTGGVRAAEPSAIGSVFDELAGTRGMGIGLPIVLGVALVVAIAVVIARRRRTAGT